MGRFFQGLPIIANVVNNKPHGSSVIVVISLLGSLMEDQARYLTNLAIGAITSMNDEDADIIQQVLNVKFCI